MSKFKLEDLGAADFQQNAPKFKMVDMGPAPQEKPQSAPEPAANLNFNQVRERFPEYEDLDDDEFAETLQKNHYQNIDLPDLKRKIGFRDEGTFESVMIGAGNGLHNVKESGESINYNLKIKAVQYKLEELARQEKLGNKVSNKRWEQALYDKAYWEGERDAAASKAEERREFYDKTPVAQSTAGGVGEGIGEFAPAMLGGLATAPMKWVSGAATAGVTTATNERFLQEGEIATNERDRVDWGSVTIAGAFGAAGEAGGRLVLSALSKAIGKIKPGIKTVNEDGSLTDDALEILSRADKGELNRYVTKDLLKKGVMSVDEAKRFNLFKEAGVDPTKANVTLKADDWVTQQDLMKKSGALREAVESQDTAINESLSATSKRLGGAPDDAVGTSEGVYGAVMKIVDDGDEAVSEAYRVASKNLGDEVIMSNTLRQTLDKTKSRNRLSNGTHEAVRGLIDEMEGAGPLTVKTAEDFRKELNQIWKNANPEGRRLIGQYKEAIDTDVANVAGDDVFAAARAAKRELEQSISPTKSGRQIRERQSIVQDIIDNKVGPERLFNKLVSSNSGRSIEDITTLKNFLMKNGQRQAWQDLQSQTIETIITKSFKGMGENGKTIAPSAFNKALESIGVRRLKLILGDEYPNLVKLKQIVEHRTPRAMTQQGSGPTGLAIQELRRRGGMFGGIIDAFGLVKDGRKLKAMIDPGAKTVKAVDDAVNSLPLPVRLGVDAVSPAAGQGVNPN